MAESCSFGSIVDSAINDSGKKQLVEIMYPNVPHNTFFRHIQYHEGVNKYKCSECDKAFLQKNDLKKHMRYVILITYYLYYTHYS